MDLVAEPPAPIRQLTIRELVQIAATRQPTPPTASHDQVSGTEARSWVFWAATACKVEPRIAFTRGPRWQYVAPNTPITRPDLSRRTARIRNGPFRDKAHQLHLDRCRVAWYMATTPFPPRGEVASQSIIAYAMRWCDRSAVSRAIDLWEATRQRRMWGDE